MKILYNTDWFFVVTDIHCPQYNATTDTECNGRGECNNVTGTCNCFLRSHYSGEACENKTKPCDGSDCNNRGVCDPLSGNCLCDTIYFGDDCECKSIHDVK